MKMHLVALAGLASGFAVFSGCASGGFGGCKLLHRAIIQNRIFNNLYYSETPQLGF